MTASVFTQQTAPPSEADLGAALGPAADAWRELDRALASDFGAVRSLRWDGPRYGWSVVHRRAGRSFVTLTPLPGRFEAMIVLGRREAELVAGLPLGSYARESFEDTPQLHDGRWLVLPVQRVEDLHDLYALLSVKLPPTRRAAVAHRLLGAHGAAPIPG